MPAKISKLHLPHVIPLLFLVAGFILAILCLAAGHKKGFMEEYALVRVCLLPLSTRLIFSPRHG